MGEELQDWLGMFSCWLRGDESGSTTIRNLGLVIAAIVAFPLALWRSKVAERQAAAAQNQSETAQRVLLNERYQKCAEMLGRDTLPIRLGGLYALARLSEEHPEQYHIEVMRLFCAFARHPVGEPVENVALTNGGILTGGAQYNLGHEKAGEELAVESGEEDDRPPRVREDVQAIMDLLRRRSEKHIALERKANFRLDLRAVNLRFGSLAKINMEGAFLMKANLSNAILSRASLVDADLSGADFEHTNLDGTDLSGARFSDPDAADPRSRPPATGLTQKQLDKAIASLDRAPQLKTCTDAVTREPLVWRRSYPA